MLHILQRFLLTCGRHGRMILILGLLGGTLLPEPAIFLQKYLPVLVVLLLFVAALRIGPRNLISNKETFRTLGPSAHDGGLYSQVPSVVSFPVVAPITVANSNSSVSMYPKPIIKPPCACPRSTVGFRLTPQSSKRSVCKRHGWQHCWKLFG